MSKYQYEKGEASIKTPLCTTCKLFKNSICKVYKKDIPKEIQFEHKDCKYYVK
jgi:hypothetical protein